MKRRAVLRRTGALGALALAGCIASDDPGGDDSTGGDGSTPTDTPTERPTDTPTPTPEPVTVTDSTIRTTAASCRSSDAAETATVAVDRAASSVTVTGVLHTADPCHRAVLDGVRYDQDAGSLHLDVVAESTDEVCVQCIGTVAYEASVTLSRGAPDRVEISHQGQVVTTASETEAGSGDDEGSTGDGTGSGDENTGSDAGSPVLVGSRIEVEAANPTGDESAPGDIEFRTDANEIVVTGTVRARNGCETATVDALAYDAGSDTLSANVVADVPPEKEDSACTQALADLTYRLTVTFDGGLPSTVEVSQEGHGGMSAAHASASAAARADGG